MMTAPTSAHSAPPAGSADIWYDWLLETRHGGDAAYAAVLAPLIRDIRDRLLEHAALCPGQAVADIGCGDGLAGFGALERQPDSRVTFVDISPALVDHTRALANARGLAERCSFAVASADALGALPDGSIDVVLVRAVLAYVPDRPSAAAEFARILRPGGRISIVDPIFADRAFAIAGMARALRSEAPSPATAALELVQRVAEAQFPATLEAIAKNPLTNYGERDLLRLLEGAGFTDLHLRLHIDEAAAPPMPWAAYLASSPHAAAPTVGEVLAAHFSPAERVAYERIVRRDVETGNQRERNVNAYLFGTSPHGAAVMPSG